MTTEARLGFNQSAAEDFSPPTKEQEEPLKPSNRFPKSRWEFISYLFREKTFFDQVSEFESFRIDVALGIIEWARFRMNGVNHGSDFPHGERPVIIGPGFGTVRQSYGVTERFFRRLGQQAEVYPLKKIANVDPVEKMVDEVPEYLENKMKKNGAKVSFIGHSKSGLMILAACLKYPREMEKCVDQVFMVGAPYPVEWVNAAIGGLYLAAQGWEGDDFAYAHEILEKADFRVLDKFKITSIGLQRDPIVRGKLYGKPEDCFEIQRGSHSGLLYNPQVLQIITHRLAGNLARTAQAFC